MLETVNASLKTPRLFVDMDGTLAEWRSLNLNIEKYEDKDSLTDKVNRILHTSGYFYSLKPHFNVVEAIRKLVYENAIDIYILSCVLPDVPQVKSYPESEKRAWLKKYLPEIREDHCIFVPDGKNKSEYIPYGKQATDFLLDDYSINLINWDKNFDTSIKYFNGKNGTKGTFNGNSISYERSSTEIAEILSNICLNQARHFDEKPHQINDDLFNVDDLNNFEYNDT